MGTGVSFVMVVNIKMMMNMVNDVPLVNYNFSICGCLVLGLLVLRSMHGRLRLWCLSSWDVYVVIVNLVRYNGMVIISMTMVFIMKFKGLLFTI